MEGYQPYKACACLANAGAPQEKKVVFEKLAQFLVSRGFTVRTAGGKDGEDAFEKGAGEKLEVHIPWKNFDGRQSAFCKTSDEAKNVVRQFSPSFESLSKGVQTIIASKAHVVLGKELNTPILFLVVWSLDGAETKKECTAKTGFVSTPIKIAESLKIPVFNLKRDDALERIKACIELM
jgi:hypothetical protein